MNLTVTGTRTHVLPVRKEPKESPRRQKEGCDQLERDQAKGLPQAQVQAQGQGTGEGREALKVQRGKGHQYASESTCTTTTTSTTTPTPIPTTTHKVSKNRNPSKKPKISPDKETESPSGSTPLPSSQHYTSVPVSVSVSPTSSPSSSHPSSPPHSPPAATHEDYNCNGDSYPNAKSGDKTKSKSTPSEKEPKNNAVTSKIKTKTKPTIAATAPKPTATSISKSKNITHPSDFLPSELKVYVRHSHSDFFVSPFFDSRLIAQLMYEGFLPIATSNYLVPKLHKFRSVIYPLHIPPTPAATTSLSSTSKSATASHGTREKSRVSNDSESDNHVAKRKQEKKAQKVQQKQQQQQHAQCAVHTSKSTKKKSKRFTMTINTDFDSVVKGCHVQHGVSWLYPPIVRAFRKMNKATQKYNEDNGKIANPYPVQLYSVEVWNAETKELAGGELGYAVGRIYTSLTGFSCEDSAGSVQLVALGHLLWSRGYDMWDLGMTLDYKTKLGAEDMERTIFVDKVKELREKTDINLVMGESESTSANSYDLREPKDCKSIIVDSTRQE